MQHWCQKWDEHWYSRHSSHGGTNGFAYAEAGGTESADQVPDGKAVNSVRRHGKKTVSDGDACACPDGGTEDQPAPFDGSIPWDTYQLQFEAVAKMNHWESRTKQLT